MYVSSSFSFSLAFVGVLNRIKCNIILILLSKFQPQHVKKDTPSVPNNEHTIHRNLIFFHSFSPFFRVRACVCVCAFNEIKFIVAIGWISLFAMLTYSLADTARLCHLFKYAGCVCVCVCVHTCVCLCVSEFMLVEFGALA